MNLWTQHDSGQQLLTIVAKRRAGDDVGTLLPRVLSQISC